MTVPRGQTGTRRGTAGLGVDLRLVLPDFLARGHARFAPEFGVAGRELEAPGERRLEHIE